MTAQLRCDVQLPHLDELLEIIPPQVTTWSTRSVEDILQDIRRNIRKNKKLELVLDQLLLFARDVDDSDRAGVNGALDQCSIDLLTGAWLSLYFLGVPFPQPWERVLQFVEKTGAFPPGGSISKAIGDLYRAARLDGAAREGVLNMTYVPLAMRRDLITCGSNGQLADKIRVLGRCYSFLQLRLYLDARLPIEYLIPEAVFKVIMRDLLEGRSDDARLTACEDFATNLRSLFPNGSDDQGVFVVDLRASVVPGCILSSQAGIFTFVTMTDGTGATGRSVPIGGGYILKERRDEYRRWLDRGSISRTGNILCMNGHELLNEWSRLGG